jgi:hypothetical protein
MTEDEKRQQKAMLLLEYQEAEATLAHLNEKARRSVESLRQIAEWLAKAYDRTWNFNPDEPIYAQGKPIKILEDPRYETSMNFQDIAKLAREIKDSMDTLRTLSERKQQLGLK